MTTTPHALTPAALAHFQLMPADQQAMAVRRLLRASWSLDDVGRVTGLSVDELVALLSSHPERI